MLGVRGYAAGMHRRRLAILISLSLFFCIEFSGPARAGEAAPQAYAGHPFGAALRVGSSGRLPGLFDPLALPTGRSAYLRFALDGGNTGRPSASPLPLHSPSGWERTAECFVLFYVRCPMGRSESIVSPPGRSVLTILLLSGTLAAVSFGIDSPDTPRWSHVNGFDDGIRSGLVAGSRGGRRGASIASDVLLGTLGAGLLADWGWKGRHARYPVANSVLTDTSWILGSLLTTQSVKLIAARQRPYVEDCRRNPRYVTSCDATGDYNKSFFSGHASLSGTLAGLICARHLAPADRDGWDWTACGGAASASLAIGLLRIAADRHYATDVLVGWAVGVAFGYTLPRMLDYRGEEGMFSRISVRPVAGMRSWGVTFSYAH